MKITLLCDHCGKSFLRERGEYNRCRKNNKKIFCRQSCSSSFNNTKRFLSEEIKEKRNQRIKQLSGNRLDKFSPFRYYIKKAKERASQYGEHNLTLEFLKDLWEKQNEICPYTGKKMHLPASSLEHDKLANPNKASLDRIDSSKGYIQGNVEFVCLAVNYAKNRFSREDILDFFKINK